MQGAIVQTHANSPSRCHLVLGKQDRRLTYWRLFQSKASKLQLYALRRHEFKPKSLLSHFDTIARGTIAISIPKINMCRQNNYKEGAVKLMSVASFTGRISGILPYLETP